MQRQRKNKQQCFSKVVSLSRSNIRALHFPSGKERIDKWACNDQFEKGADNEGRRTLAACSEMQRSTLSEVREGWCVASASRISSVRVRRSAATDFAKNRRIRFGPFPSR